MPNSSEKLLEQLNISRDRNKFRQIIPLLAIMVTLGVFWSLKLTGIGIAGEAFCGMDEHVHSEQCEGGLDGCILEEHTHVGSCYSDITADIETSDDWEGSLREVILGPTTKASIVSIAKSQLGYAESTLNFQVDAAGVRRGITRYGQWYGNPYGNWSAMFASFCLEHAGATDLPMNAGPESMRLEWIEEGLYKSFREHSPEAGLIVFLSKDGASTEAADSVAIITSVDDTSITVIEGDLDGTVSESRYSLDSGVIMGYGLIHEADSLIVLDAPAAAAQTYTVWLDGTDGGLGLLTGSPNTAYKVQGGSTLKLPDEWTSPSKYSYKLRGWYDVTNSRYYPAGAEMQVNGNAVLYADWVASTYDLGVFNAQVSDTVSTDSFVTTHLFDYNYLFNIQSSNPQVTVNANSHSETWSLVSSGNVKYNGQQTFDFVFTDNDSEGRMNMPNNRDNKNRYHDATTVTSGIYTADLGDRLFSTENAFDPSDGSGILGKTYLGTGDHLFQLMEDKSDEHYGYYYYDSKRNAASYNQTNERFYVYDYLAATSDSIGGAYSDFLPLNSPYANNNGKTVGRFTYDGVDGEYAGVSHYRYDSKYDSGNHNSTSNVSTDYAYGMRLDINFYLPNNPGTGGNKDIYGNDMQFQFSGDDDLWVLIDGKVALDIGGIHQIVAGSIDFSTGKVVVNGAEKTSLVDLGITAGDHIMTVLYLERGSSMSNCAIYFNLAPRFGLQLQKEDILTQELLNGAKFTVYEDAACTNPAELWKSQADYNADFEDGVLDNYQSTFTVENGITSLWGLGSGNTYYIKETGPPNKVGYSTPFGIIRLKIEKEGEAMYLVDVVPDENGNEPSNGFTVHNVKIDEGTQTVYISVTNAPDIVVETTTVQVIKKWEDTESHSEDYIQAYLTVTDPDGTVRRIREITLSDENDWMYIWTSLPKYDYGTMTEVQYGIEESYESGYYSTVRQITQLEISKTEWGEATAFINNESYILKHSSGYLSTVSSSNAKLTWVNEATAKESELATWTATVTGSGSNTKVTFKNGVGQTLTFVYSNYSNNRYFHAVLSATSIQPLSPVDAGSGFYFYGTRSNSSTGTKYYMASSGINSSGRISTTTSTSSALILTPMKKIVKTDIRDVQDWAYQITNTPLPKNNETSMSVKKEWVVPNGYNETWYQEYSVTVRLLANGINTGRSITLNLKNGWEGEFLGLPYKDEQGNVIEYTVVEAFEQKGWAVNYGEITSSNTSPPKYSTVVTNTYYPGGPELPSTGSAARLNYIICGSFIIMGTLIYGILSRYNQKRRLK